MAGAGVAAGGAVGGGGGVVAPRPMPSWLYLSFNDR